MILHSHPTGNAYVRHTALAFCEADLLSEFWTCISWNPETPLARLLPSKVRNQFARRTFDKSVRERTHLYPWRELGRLFSPTLKLDFLTRHEAGCFSVDAVFHSLDSRVAKRLPLVPGLRAIYAGEDGARDTFLRAHSLGIKSLYELPIGYWRVGHSIYNEEKEREPQWAGTLTGMRDSEDKLARKDEELRLADLIFVASSYTRSTLDAAPGVTAPTHVVPYGAPVPIEKLSLERANPSKLKIIFVGALSQRKGLSYLLSAVETLGDQVELTIIGKKTDAHCVPLEAALRRHRWIESLPHADVLREMQSHDVLVFPSLFEGFAMVLTEAMSQGLPVITTPHTAGPDIITEGKEGFIVPIRSVEPIVEKLTLLIENPQMLDQMKIAAWNKARILTWANYRSSLAKIVRAEVLS